MESVFILFWVSKKIVVVFEVYMLLVVINVLNEDEIEIGDCDL